jgi:HSP20 family protein
MLTRWNNTSWPSPWFGDPLQDISAFGELRRTMDRMFEELDRRFAAPAFGTPTPRFELVDTGEALEVRADLPGFRQEDLDVQIERNTLTVRGRRTVDVPEGYVAHRRERTSMEVAHALTLPCRIDADGATATLENGVLTLRLPKLPDEQPRRIKVKVA